MRQWLFQLEEILSCMWEEIFWEISLSAPCVKTWLKLNQQISWMFLFIYDLINNKIVTKNKINYYRCNIYWNIHFLCRYVLDNNKNISHITTHFLLQIFILISQCMSTRIQNIKSWMYVKDYDNWNIWFLKVVTVYVVVVWSANMFSKFQ